MLNVNFKGYSNIVSVHKVPLSNLEISYIGLKLDDEGEKDLSKLREIREMQRNPKDNKNDDILTFIHVTDKKSEELYFSENLMCWGEQLKIVKEEHVPRFISNNEFKQIETVHMKAYTLLASLTRRMTYDKFENEDSNYKRVLDVLYNNLQKIGKKDFPIFTQKEAFWLTSLGCLKQFKFQPLAAKFNKKIMATMTTYFK